MKITYEMISRMYHRLCMISYLTYYHHTKSAKSAEEVCSAILSTTCLSAFFPCICYPEKSLVLCIAPAVFFFESKLFPAVSMFETRCKSSVAVLSRWCEASRVDNHSGTSRRVLRGSCSGLPQLNPCKEIFFSSRSRLSRRHIDIGHHPASLWIFRSRRFQIGQSWQAKQSTLRREKA